MDTEEALYAAVGEELRQGNIRQGLWAKALADEGYDEQKAKARYLKLRVRSLRMEVAEALSNEQAKTRVQQQQQKEQAIQSGFQQLEWRAAGLSQLQRARMRIRTVGFWLPFVIVGLLLATLYAKDETTGLVGTISIAVGLGLLAGVLGFVIAEVTRWFMPSQRQLEREEAEIKVTRANLEYARKSWLGRFWTNALNLIIGAIIIVYVIALVVKQFAK